jgi:hypothetical protein
MLYTIPAARILANDTIVDSLSDTTVKVESVEHYSNNGIAFVTLSFINPNVPERFRNRAPLATRAYQASTMISVDI